MIVEVELIGAGHRAADGLLPWILTLRLLFTATCFRIRRSWLPSYGESMSASMGRVKTPTSHRRLTLRTQQFAKLRYEPQSSPAGSVGGATSWRRRGSWALRPPSSSRACTTSDTLKTVV